MKYIIVFCLLFKIYNIGAQKPNDIWKIKLSDENGKYIKIKKICNQHEGLICFIFFNEECPICQYYIPYIDSLNKASDKSKFKLIPVICHKINKKEFSEFKKIYELDLSFYFDHKFKLASSLVATTTPEVYLYDIKQDKVIYSGKIDDSFIALGERNLHVKTNYISDAISKFYNGFDILIKRTEPIGCLLNY
jgi:thiol-disulfide isomerase/thioredoxin